MHFISSKQDFITYLDMDLGCPFSKDFSNQTNTVFHTSSKLPLKIFFRSLSIRGVSLDLVFEDGKYKKSQFFASIFFSGSRRLIHLQFSAQNHRWWHNLQWTVDDKWFFEAINYYPSKLHRSIAYSSSSLLTSSQQPVCVY